VAANGLESLGLLKISLSFFLTFFFSFVLSFFPFILSFCFILSSILWPVGARVALAIASVCRLKCIYKRISNGFKTHCHKRISDAFRRRLEMLSKAFQATRLKCV